MGATSGPPFLGGNTNTGHTRPAAAERPNTDACEASVSSSLGMSRAGVACRARAPNARMHRLCKSCTSFLRRLSGEYMYSLRTFQIRASVFSRARCANRPAAAVALRKLCQRVSVFETSIPRCVFCVCRPQLRGIFGDQLGCEAVDTVRCLTAGCHQRGTLLFRFLARRLFSTA